MFAINERERWGRERKVRGNGNVGKLIRVFYHNDHWCQCDKTFFGRQCTKLECLSLSSFVG